MSCNAEVDEIGVDSQNVVRYVRVGEKRYSCDIVVSNADVYHTYSKLLAKTDRGKKRARSLSKQDFSMSLFVLYFGTNRDFPDIAHHNIFFGERYKELLDDIFNKGIVADDFSLYLHAPCKTDPALAPEGCASFYVLAPVPNLEKCDFDWQKNADAFADKILKYIDARYMPGLLDSIVVKKIFTPNDFESELNSYQGAAFSLTPTLTQSAWFRVHNRDPQIKGLYFSGAGTHPGAGVPGVVGSAKATCSVIAQDYQL
jgi:phytoene desaturase